MRAVWDRREAGVAARPALAGVDAGRQTPGASRQGRYVSVAWEMLTRATGFIRR